ncbi:MAG: hypothetical protein IJE74_06750 [Clostridia bacterium]|nr:hypothetical protein [Clostridia bacterium]
MKTKVIRITVFFVVILIIPIFTLFGEKETVSYNENKILAEFPELSLENWKSRSFMNGMSDYFSDHFILRESFIKVKNSIEKALGKTEINGVIENDGYLIQTFKGINYTLTDRNIASLNKLKAKNPDTPFYFMPIVTAQEKFKEKLPSYLDVTSESEYTEYCFEKLNGIEKIDVSREICSIDYAFYRTDHHWTTDAAYEAYLKLSDTLGIVPFSKNTIQISTVSDNFKGTLYSKTLNEKIKPDIIKVYKSDTNFRLIIKDKEYNGLYFNEFLNEKDKYSYFLSGNHGICTVKNDDSEVKKKLLIIKDSYANCIIPFIAEHFSEITVVDPRYCSHTQIKEINPSEYNATLILFNVSGFSSEQNFPIIEFMGEKQ